MENYIAGIIFSVTLMGYVLYIVNIFKEETQNFLLMPWILFSLLAFLDYENILRSANRTWIEAFAGGLVFLGPCIVSFLIVSSGWYIHRNEEKWYLMKKIRNEFLRYKAESLMVLICVIVLILLRKLDGEGFYGSEYFLELIFAVVTIILDVIAVVALRSEVIEKPAFFENKSWFLWILALMFAYIWNLSDGASIFSIGSILVLENLIMTLWIFITIQKFKNMWYIYKLSPAFYVGLNAV